MDSSSFFHTGVISLILLWHSNVKPPKSFAFKFPETCYIMNNVWLEAMWCVLLLIMRGLWDVHHCALWYLIIHLCGGLAVWITFASFDKGTPTITYSIWFLYFCVWLHISSNEFVIRTFWYIANICLAHTHLYMCSKLDEHLMLQLKPEYYCFWIEM